MFLQVPKKPIVKQNDFVCIEDFWIEVGDKEVFLNPNYIRTKSINKYIKNLARIIAAQKFPILLQVWFG